MAPGTTGGPQIMVMLAPAPPAILGSNTAALAQTYRLRTVYSWNLASLGEQCVVFEVTGGRQAEDVARPLASDPGSTRGGPGRRLRHRILPVTFCSRTAPECGRLLFPSRSFP